MFLKKMKKVGTKSGCYFAKIGKSWHLKQGLGDEIPIRHKTSESLFITITMKEFLRNGLKRSHNYRIGVKLYT